MPDLLVDLFQMIWVCWTACGKTEVACSSEEQNFSPTCYPTRSVRFMILRSLYFLLVTLSPQTTSNGLKDEASGIIGTE